MRGGSWRAVGAAGAPYPAWVRELHGRSGVYALRDRATGRVLYVGESHTGRLLKTLTRHLQGWRRGKSFWSEFFRVGNQSDPGTIYVRDAVEVMVVACPAGQAVALQDRWIRELRPRDNQLGKSGADEVPF